MDNNESNVITEDMIHDALLSLAYNLSIIRKAELLKEDLKKYEKIPSSKEDERKDWNDANISLISKFLDGDISFIEHISSQSYYRLEEMWLKDIKELKAYFIWLNREDRDRLSQERKNETKVEDYFKACEDIRTRLVNKDIKFLREDFKKVKDYLENHYLKEWKADYENNPNLYRLIERKARRIWETTGENDPKINWYRAEMYVRMFYENIIPAVIENNIENVLMVLRAFQFSKAPENRYLIINCFETAIAMYFLKAETIESLWKDPDLSNFSIVPVKEWPLSFKVPSICKRNFEVDRGKRQITFKGVMSEEQQEALLDSVTMYDHKAAIKVLFNQSRLDPRKMTL